VDDRFPWEPSRVLRIGLGILWLVDGILQMQPGMFTMDMVSDVMQPAATAQPAWLQHLIAWSIHLVTPRLVAFNWGIVALQLLIGLLLLTPWRRTERAGLILSVLWGAAVWLFGEGLGQLLTGTATFLAGAPGSAFYYALFSVFLLAAGKDRALEGPRNPLLLTLVLSLGLAALLQLAPTFWTPLGLAAPFGQAAMMPQPLWLRAAIDAVGTLAARAPVAVNLTLVLVPAALALLLLLRPRAPLVLAAVGVYLFLVWAFGQDFGMLGSGMATDPNSAPVLLLALLAQRRPAPSPVPVVRRAEWRRADV
jgi:hypothetical protein